MCGILGIGRNLGNVESPDELATAMTRFPRNSWTSGDYQASTIGKLATPNINKLLMLRHALVAGYGPNPIAKK